MTAPPLRCPTCHGPTVGTDRTDVRFCTVCWTDLRGAEVPRTVRKRPEAVLVRDIVAALRAAGRTVLRVGQRRCDLAGSDAGVPDLLLWCPARQSWLGLEAKTAQGRLSVAQRALVEAGMVIVIRSVEDALEAAR